MLGKKGVQEFVTGGRQWFDEPGVSAKLDMEMGFPKYTEY